MLPTHNIGHIILATGLALLALPHAATARGSGHGSMSGMASRTSAQASHPSPSSAAALSAAAAAFAPPAPPPAVPSDTLPPSAIGAPAPQLMSMAPPSPVPDTPVLSGGGPVRADTVPSATPTSTSPSEAAASTPGGGGETLEACMGFWDRGTHMTKGEWRAACTRTLNRLDLRTPVP
jgi:hypothetical protein